MADNNGYGGMTALVTGASSGIGAAFAEKLAAKGYKLILVARRRNLLNDIAARLEAEYGTPARVEPADLRRELDVSRLENVIKCSDDLSVLVNNAGFAIQGMFSEHTIEEELDMVRVHDIASMRFIHAALPGMMERGRGDIISISSLAGLLPFAGHPTYNASKAFLISLTEALQFELAGTGVRLLAVCPGFTRTGFHEAMGVDMSRAPDFMWQGPEEVVEESLEALERGRVVLIPGRRNRAFNAALGLLPRRLRYRIMSMMTSAIGR